jgi:hypothetical protein
VGTETQASLLRLGQIPGLIPAQVSL